MGIVFVCSHEMRPIDKWGFQRIGNFHGETKLAYWEISAAAPYGNWKANSSSIHDCAFWHILGFPIRMQCLCSRGEVTVYPVNISPGR